MHIQICFAFDNQYILSGYTMLDTATFLYTHIQKSKSTEKGGSSENEDQTDSKHGNACQRENQNG